MQKLITFTSLEAKTFYQTFYSGKDFKKKVSLEIEGLYKNFRYYFKIKTNQEILDISENKNKISKVLDKDNSLDVDLKEIDAFFITYLDWEKGTLKVDGIVTK
jgi:hypothetical protein